MNTKTYLTGLLLAVAALATAAPVQAGVTDLVNAPFEFDGSQRVCQDPVDVLCDCPTDRDTSHCRKGESCILYDSILYPPQCNVGRLASAAESYTVSPGPYVPFWLSPVPLDVGPSVPVESTDGPPVFGGYCMVEVNGPHNAIGCFPNEADCNGGWKVEATKGADGPTACLMDERCLVKVLLFRESDYVGFYCTY